MVGGLVQQQHVWAGHQGLRQRDSLACPSREGAHDGLRGKVQAVQSFLYPLLPVPGVISLDLRLQCIQIKACGAPQVLFPQRDRFAQPAGGGLEDGVLRL